RSTPASRRSSTPVVALPASRRATPRRTPRSSSPDAGPRARLCESGAGVVVCQHPARSVAGVRHRREGRLAFEAVTAPRTVPADLEAARELAGEDPAFAEEAEALAARRTAAEERLRHLLVPRDPADDKDAIVEIKSGEGGEESALFAGDLLRMYTRYAE